MYCFRDTTAWFLESGRGFWSINRSDLRFLPAAAGGTKSPNVVAVQGSTAGLGASGIVVQHVLKMIGVQDVSFASTLKFFYQRQKNPEIMDFDCNPSKRYGSVELLIVQQCSTNHFASSFSDEL